MSDMGTGQPTTCPSCNRAVAPNMRRCPGCGAWMRPWSVGGRPSRTEQYRVGGAGRPEGWGAQIGRRYRRQDEAGTPYCVTVDFESLDDQAVTIRDRDSLAQDRVPIDDLVEEVRSRLCG